MKAGTAIISFSGTEVLGDNGEVLDVIDENDSCNQSPPCGGCGACMIAQAVHAGLELREDPDSVVVQW